MVEPKRHLKGRTINYILWVMLRMGLFDAIRRINPSVLTILNYHRVEDVSRPEFDTFSPNVTASPAEFARQMDFLKRAYHIISCDLLSAWLRGEIELPPHAALITFDDGYFDNYAHAYPVLKARNLSAVIFLTTSLIGGNHPIYWDRVAYCFFHTRKRSANLPLWQDVSWADAGNRRLVMKQWIEIIKRLPDEEKQKAVDSLADILEVSIPEDAFSNLYLSWDQVREMSQNGIEMGSHTVLHPILTRIPLSRVEQELVESKQLIEAEIQKPVISFAYPNGTRSDFSPSVIKHVRQAGYEMAFTLVGGTSPYSQVRRNPLKIPRIFLGSSDVFPRFVAKLSLGRIGLK